MSAARVPDDNLTDDDLRSEIEMVSELVLAATKSDGPLRQDEVDLLLGIDPKHNGIDPKHNGQAANSED